MSRAPTTIVTGEKPAEPVSLEALRSHCNVVAADATDQLKQLLETARMMVECDSHLSLVRKTVRHRLPCWPPASSAIKLPMWPAISITSIKYRDTDGNEQTIDEADYREDLDERPAAIYLAAGKTWPAVEVGGPNAITITYEAGFQKGVKAPPSQAVHAIKLLVGHWYQNREATGSISNEIELGYERLINQLLEESYP